MVCLTMTLACTTYIPDAVIFLVSLQTVTLLPSDFSHIFYLSLLFISVGIINDIIPIVMNKSRIRPDG
jgi:hypothetical protein